MIGLIGISKFLEDLYSSSEHPRFGKIPNYWFFFLLTSNALWFITLIWYLMAVTKAILPIQLRFTWNSRAFIFPVPLTTYSQLLPLYRCFVRIFCKILIRKSLYVWKELKPDLVNLVLRGSLFSFQEYLSFGGCSLHGIAKKDLKLHSIKLILFKEIYNRFGCPVKVMLTFFAI